MLQSSQKNIQGAQHPLIRVGRKNRRRVMMKAAIQNTKKKTDTNFNLHRKIFKVHTIHKTGLGGKKRGD